MTDENANTADLTPNEKLDQVLRKLGDLDARLATIEARADDRARETRPKLDTIIKELADLREENKDVVRRLDRIQGQLRVLTEDVMQVRTDQRRLEDRMDDLERRPNGPTKPTKQGSRSARHRRKPRRKGRGRNET